LTSRGPFFFLLFYKKVKKSEKKYKKVFSTFPNVMVVKSLVGAEVQTQGGAAGAQA